MASSKKKKKSKLIIHKETGIKFQGMKVGEIRQNPGVRIQVTLGGNNAIWK